MTGAGSINIEVRPKGKANGLQGAQVSTLWFSWRFPSDDPKNPQPMHVVPIELVPQELKELGAPGDDAADVANKLRDAIRKKVSEPQSKRNPNPMTKEQADKITIAVQERIGGHLPGYSTFMTVEIPGIDHIDCACCEADGQVIMKIGRIRSSCASQVGLLGRG